MAKKTKTQTIEQRRLTGNILLLQDLLKKLENEAYYLSEVEHISNDTLLSIAGAIELVIIPSLKSIETK